MGFRIIEERTFERMKQMIKDLHEKSRRLMAKAANGEWLDNQDTTQLLGVSKRTLQSYRDKGVLPFSQIGHKCYYKRTDVIELLKKSRMSNK